MKTRKYDKRRYDFEKIVGRKPKNEEIELLKKFTAKVVVVMIFGEEMRKEK